jgi:CelD/BcsL family acetyltransferase involved in cellulose biosynthesis
MPSPDLRTEVLRHLGPHRPAWDRIVADQPLPSPFLRSWWVEHAAGAEPCIVACFDGDELVGGAAFELDRLGPGGRGPERVRCLGQGVLAPDHLDLVAATGQHRRVARAVLAWLRRPGARVLDLDGLAATGTLATLFSPFEVERVAAPFADLGVGIDEYLAGRPGKVRSTISRTSKRFAREGVTLDTVDADAPSDHLDAALDDLARLHDSRWSDDSAFLSGWDRVRAAVHAGVTAGDVGLHRLLDQHGDAVAVELDLCVGPRVGFYQAGRRTEREWRGCGSVLRARIIEAAVAEGATEYDLLRGDEGYKAEWATGRRELVHCVAGVGPLGQAAVLARRWRHELVRRRSPDTSTD